MNKEKKSKEKENKILAFDISDEALYDPEMDDFLKDCIRQQADDLEKELNQKPSLRGVGASDDLFLSIVGQLKEQGVWEEENPEIEEIIEHIPETELSAEDMMVQKPEDMPDQKAKDMSGQKSEDIPGQKSEDMSGQKPKDMPGRKSEDMSGQKPEDMPDRKSEDMSGQKPEDMPGQKLENMAKQGAAIEIEEKAETAEITEDAETAQATGITEDAEAVKSVGTAEHVIKADAADITEDAKNAKVAKIAENTEKVKTTGITEDAGKSRTAQTAEITRDKEKAETTEITEDVESDETAKRAENVELSIDEIYDRLSEKDRKTVDLVRKMEQKQAAKSERWRRRRKYAKPLGAAAAMLVIMVGAGMSTEANRRLVLQAWETVAEHIGFYTRTELVEESDRIYSKTKEEIEAMQEIEDTLGIDAIDFGYMPSGMEFLSCESNEDMELGATLFYSYQEKIMSIEMIKMNNEAVFYFNVDNETVLRDTVVTDQKIEVEIWEANLDLEEDTYIAIFEYKDCRYIINAMISLEEMTKMVKSIYFL